MQPAVRLVAPVDRRPKRYEGYLAKQSLVLGIAAIVIGVLCFIFNVVSAVYIYYDNMAPVGHGFWCGALFIVTGAFGIGASKTIRLCQIVTFMTMNIISASFTIALLTVGIIGAASVDPCSRSYYGYSYGNDCYRYNNYYYYGPCYNPPCPDKSNYQLIIAMESLLAILGVIEAIVAIWGAAICCKSGICCCSNQAETVQPSQVLSSGYLSSNGALIYIQQTQGGQHNYTPQPIMPYPQALVAPPPYCATFAQLGWNSQQPMAASGASTMSQPPPAPTSTPPIYTINDQAAEKPSKEENV